MPRNGRASSKAEKGSKKVEVVREKAVSASPAPRKQKERPYRIDVDDENYIKDLRRPAVIKEDLSEMERRKRVQEILESKSFCQELEMIIRQESECAHSDAEQLRTLQKLADLTLPPVAPTTSPSIQRLGGSPPAPIADLRCSEEHGKDEIEARNQLAALLRLIDLFHWSQGIYNHITVRVPGRGDEIVVNPFGLLYHEITASMLIRTTLDGDILDNGASMLGINQAAFLAHSAILQGRPDVNCVIHLQSAIVTAVSSLKCGLLPICQEAMLIGPVGYHEFLELDDDEAEKAAIVEHLGDKNVLVLRNNGVVAVGSTLQEAVLYAHHTVVVCETQILLIRGDGAVIAATSIDEGAFLTRNLIAACDQQIRASKAGLENIYVPSERAFRRAHDVARNKVMSPRRSQIFDNGNGHVDDGKENENVESPNGNHGDRLVPPQLEWGIGELEWEAFMRVLDNAGYHTGHKYKQPQLKPKQVSILSDRSPIKQQSDIASPPVTSAHGMVNEDDAESLMAHKMALLRKEQEKAKWLNSPVNYQKIEFLESGTAEPKIITKWVADHITSPQAGTPIKIASPNQFAPLSANGKEFREKQKEIKENRLAGAMSAGPQSQVFEGAVYDEINISVPKGMTQIPDDRSVLIGTASKGIIDRQYQHNAQVYRQLYAVNPFIGETDEDLKRYMDEVSSKSPQSTCRPFDIDDTFTFTRSESPFQLETPGIGGFFMDNVSLIQGARECRARREAKKSASMDDEKEDAPEGTDSMGRSMRETTFDSSDALTTSRSLHTTRSSTVPRGTTLYLDESYSETPKGRPAVDRQLPHGRPLSDCTTVSAHSGGFTSDEEAKSEKKKKKSGMFSFLRRSKRDKTPKDKSPKDSA